MAKRKRIKFLSTVRLEDHPDVADYVTKRMNAGEKQRTVIIEAITEKLEREKAK